MTDVIDTGLTSLPEIGIHTINNTDYEIRHSCRGNWYAMRIEPDGSRTYVAQNIDIRPLGLERQRCIKCTEQAIFLSGLCKTHDAPKAGNTSRPGRKTREQKL